MILEIVELTGIEGFAGFLLPAPAALIQVRVRRCTTFATAIANYQLGSR